MLLEHGLELQDRERLDRQIGSVSLGDDKSMTVLTQAPRKRYCESQRAAFPKKYSRPRYSGSVSSKSSQVKSSQVKKDRSRSETDQEIHHK